MPGKDSVVVSTVEYGSLFDAANPGGCCEQRLFTHVQLRTGSLFDISAHSRRLPTGTTLAYEYPVTLCCLLFACAAFSSRHHPDLRVPRPQQLRDASLRGQDRARARGGLRLRGVRAGQAGRLAGVGRAGEQDAH